MATVAESSNRLFWLIVLSIFLPYIAIGLEFGFSKPLAIDFGLGFVVPVLAVIVGGAENVSAIVVGQLFSFAAVIFAIHQLIKRRYADAEAAEVEMAPPSYTPATESEAAPSTEPQSKV